MELAGDTFDVDEVRALTLLAGGDSGAARPLSQYNLAARIEADSFTIGDYQLDGFETSLVWRDGLLNLDSLNFDDFGGASGNFSASLEGSVAAPRGTVKGAFSAEDAAGLFDLADQATGGHQIIRRLAANSAAFDDVLADVSLVLEPEAGPELTVEGVSGGSAFRFRAGGTGFMPGGDGPRTVALEAENPEAYRLLEQSGFAVLPLEGEGPASLMISADGGAADGDLAIRAELTSGQSRLALAGNAAIPASDPATGLFELEMTAADIEPFAMMFGVSLPQTGAGLPLSVKANIGMTDSMILASGIEGTAETNGFSGELEFDRLASGISGEGALRVDRADLGWLGELALGAEQFGTGGATWNDAAFLPPAPGQPEMRIALEAAEMSLGPAGTTRDFSASLSTGTGAMALEQAEAQWFGGRLGGNVSVTNADGSAFLSGRISATDTDLAALERAIHGSSVLVGPGKRQRQPRRHRQIHPRACRLARRWRGTGGAGSGGVGHRPRRLCPHSWRRRPRGFRARGRPGRHDGDGLHDRRRNGGGELAPALHADRRGHALFQCPESRTSGPALPAMPAWISPSFGWRPTGD